jgi:hypothetical protein
MGLFITNDCWRGSYLMFGRFRYNLVMQILKDYNESSGISEEEFILSNATFIKIKPLLHHSDCDGELSPEECKQIAEGLDLIVDKYNEEVVEECDLFWEMLIRFRDGCIDAYQRNEFVYFM